MVTGLRRFVKRLFAEVNREAIIVLGNQKSGTTAVAALLSSYAGLSATLDIDDARVDEQDRVHDGSLPFEQFVQRHRAHFAAGVVKEPGLTFVYDRVRQSFPSARAVFVVRDPRDNIRSILDWLGFRGDLDHSPSMSTLRTVHRRIMDNRWMGLEGDHYIDSLSSRWNRAVDVYLRHRQEMVLVRYESFSADKSGTVRDLAAALGLPARKDISSALDTPYQPRGARRDVPWTSFFGARNLERIERSCGPRMKEFGYVVETGS